MIELKPLYLVWCRNGTSYLIVDKSYIEAWLGPDKFNLYVDNRLIEAFGIRPTVKSEFENHYGWSSWKQDGKSLSNSDFDIVSVYSSSLNVEPFPCSRSWGADIEPGDVLVESNGRSSWLVLPEWAYVKLVYYWMMLHHDKNSDYSEFTRFTSNDKLCLIRPVKGDPLDRWFDRMLVSKDSFTSMGFRVQKAS